MLNDSQIGRWKDQPEHPILPILVAAAGFEARSLAVARELVARQAHIETAYVLDYPDTALNEPMRSELFALLKQVARVVLPVPLPQKMGQELLLPVLEPGAKVMVDITGMDRVVLFQALNAFDRSAVHCDILYTEAEEYYPERQLYQTLIEDEASVDKAFANYLAKEKAEFAYSYDCSLVQPTSFRGNPEPCKPFMLIAFFAFKRSRLQLLLQTMEAERKLFILSEPVREDLRWRKEFMRIANWDLIRKNVDAIRVLRTLYPNEVAVFLESQTYTDFTYAKYNLVLAPLGSKMQTLGAYCYWRRHKDVSVMFTHPHQFFPRAYSKSYRDTFIVPFEDLCRIPERSKTCAVGGLQNERLPTGE